MTFMYSSTILNSLFTNECSGARGNTTSLQGRDILSLHKTLRNVIVLSLLFEN
jgi:hypothetical protein